MKWEDHPQRIALKNTYPYPAGMPLRHAHGGRLRRGAQGVEEVRRCLGADSEGRREERLQSRRRHFANAHSGRSFIE